MALSPSLRKAAILVASLDDAAADQLLDQMGEQQAARVRHALMSLDDIDPAEQEEVLAEFFGRPAAQVDEPHGVEFEISSESRAAAQRLEAAKPAAPIVPAGPRFAFLHDAHSEDLARKLCREHPQLIAVVAAHLPPAKSADVLQYLPAKMQTEVLKRLGDLDDTDPEIVAELSSEMERIFASSIRPIARRGKQYEHVQAILSHLDAHKPSEPLADKLQTLSEPVRTIPIPTKINHPSVRDAANVTRTSAQTSAIPRPQAKPVAATIKFDELLALSADEFFAVFDEADPRIVMLALAGAPRRMFERYAGQFSLDRAAEFERHIEQLRPLRLRDVEEAQREVAKIAERQRSAAKSAAETSRRFAAAA